MRDRLQLRKRVLSAMLAFALTVGMLPFGLGVTARAAEDSWAQAYLDKLVGWGVMRGDLDGSLAPDRDITRAEFVTMVNRAYGYDEVGVTTFKDVLPADWFAEDIAIAYKAGYFTGTSANTASPNSTLTREEATILLGRNLLLQESVGESLAFTDSRDLDDWSRGMVKAAAEQGVVNGYPDGSFRPQNNVTRGEVAALLVSAIGTPIQAPGDYTLGGTYGNVTISSSGVTLRNTTIAGDLYITGGVGLGFVTLENVTVLGKIIASGAGESNKGESSIILRNVEAEEMVVDSLTNQYVAIRSEGDTNIAKTSVRTSSYLEDVTSADAGLKYIELNGEAGIGLELAGNIGEVVNMTPNSSLVVAQGLAGQVTVDERAVNAKLTVQNGAEVKKLNLDVGVNVSGGGDVGELVVNSNGSNVTILPDSISVRPGVTTNVSGQNMDTVVAEEASADPRILSGYPDAKDIAPTTATGAFSANKSGTIYWAVSAVADGSVGEDDLISPPTYGSKIVNSGKVEIKNSNAEVTSKISKLTSDGSYYLAAVLVDSRGGHSPVKVSSFSTPDDTTPNFASGYPSMTKITHNSAQVTVMPTKSCQLYYALLPKGSTAPKGADFKAGAVSGNLGYGNMDVIKNATRSFTVNRDALEELATYDLYLWLTDHDGAKSSTVKKVTFTTVDGTPPIFNTVPTPNAVKNTSIGFMFNLNEAGTVYWVAVKAGTEYPKPMAGHTGKVSLDSEEAKLQVVSGMNALKSGKTSATGNKDGSFTVSGLTEQTSYDIYYVAVDKAGNYSNAVGVISANTLDDKAPNVTQEFTRYNGTDKETPLADTDIRLVFSEGVQEADVKFNPNGKSLFDLYQEVTGASTNEEKAGAKQALADALRRTVLLYDATNPGNITQVKERNADGVTNWVVDYRNAEVTMEDGKTVVTLRTGNGGTDAAGALNLSSGSTYYFKLQGLADTSSAKNVMGVTQLKNFTTVFAQVNLNNTGGGEATLEGDSKVDLHMSFELHPISTEKVADDIFWDMLIWSDTNVSFKLYYREKSLDGSGGSWTPLGRVGDQEQSITTTSNDFDGLSLSRHFMSANSGQPTFARLNQLKDDKVYEYGILFTKVDGSSDAGTWSQTVNFKVSVAAASNASELTNLSASITPGDWENARKEGITSIGLPDNFTIKKVFTDQKAPVFVDDYPKFVPTDSSVTMNVLLDRPGTVYYVVAPVEMITTRDNSDDKREINKTSWNMVPDSGKRDPGTSESASKIFELSTPGYLNITNPKYSNSAIKYDKKEVGTGVVEIPVRDLLPDTKYLAYFVLKGTGQVFSENVMCYRFETPKVTRPVITLEVSNPEVSVKVDRDSTVDYLLVVSNFTDSILQKKMSDVTPAALQTELGSYANKTVMEALLEDFKKNDKTIGSVFDYFADQEYKDSLADLIRNRNVNSESITLKKQITVKGNQTVYVDCTPGMSGITRYTFLAVGKSDLGSGDSFRAIRPVFLRDAEAPKVVSVSLTVDDDYPDTATKDFKGTLSIQFNKDLYWYDRDEGTNRKIVHWKDPVAKLAYVSLGYACKLPAAGGINIKDARPSENPVSTIDFEILKGRDNMVISIPNNLSNATGSTREQPLTITIKYEKVLKEDGTIDYYQPVVNITKQWDART